MAEYFSYLDDWSDRQHGLYRDTFEPIGGFDDPVAQALFDNGYFNRDVSSDDRAAIRAQLDEYVRDTYGYEFDDVFDWQAWRDAYGGTE